MFQHGNDGNGVEVMVTVRKRGIDFPGAFATIDKVELKMEEEPWLSTAVGLFSALVTILTRSLPRFRSEASFSIGQAFRKLATSIDCF